MLVLTNPIWSKFNVVKLYHGNSSSWALYLIFCLFFFFSPLFNQHFCPDKRRYKRSSEMGVMEMLSQAVMSHPWASTVNVG